MATPVENATKLANVTARGGYQILDFHNTVFTLNTDIAIPGIYAYLKKMLPLTKPLLLCNLSINDDGSIDTVTPQYAVLFDVAAVTPAYIKIDFDNGKTTMAIFDNDAVRVSYVE